MSARYHRWLMPKGSAFLPSGAGIAKLIERLRKDGWIPGSGGYAAKTVDNDFTDDAARRAASRERLPSPITAAWLDDPDREELRVVWQVEGKEPHAAKYPLSRKVDGPAPYSIELHRASDYVYPVSETIGRVPTKCACGDDLAFGWDEDEVVPAFEASTGIFHECEACSRTFDPSKGLGTIKNPFDGSTEQVRGGAAYRFALKVDCGKSFVADAALCFLPELVALVQDEFGRDFFEVGDLY
jgi:hypothetical protein